MTTRPRHRGKFKWSKYSKYRGNLKDYWTDSQRTTHRHRAKERTWRTLVNESSVAVPCDWILLERTHQRHEICDQGCVIHNRTAHHMQWWPLHWRGDRGIFERICLHGIGHPDPDQFPFWESTGQLWGQGIHGCDGCCDPPAVHEDGDAFVAHLDRLDAELSDE